MRDDRVLALQYATVAVSSLDVEEMDAAITEEAARRLAKAVDREIDRLLSTAMNMPPAVRSSFLVTGPEPERRLYAVNVGVMA